MLAIHVDDLKLTGEEHVIKEIVDHLEAVFGKLILQWHKFTNCGVRHIQDPSTYVITLDQVEYIAALKPLNHPSIKGAKLTDTILPDLFLQFSSLRGAVAYTLLTRTDVCVCSVLTTCAGDQYNLLPR